MIAPTTPRLAPFRTRGGGLVYAADGKRNVAVAQAFTQFSPAGCRSALVAVANTGPAHIIRPLLLRLVNLCQPVGAASDQLRAAEQASGLVEEILLAEMHTVGIHEQAGRCGHSR